MALRESKLNTHLVKLVNNSFVLDILLFVKKKRMKESTHSVFFNIWVTLLLYLFH